MEKDSRSSGVAIERVRKEAGGHVREREKRRRWQEGCSREKEGEFQDLCSCVSILNNQVCVRGSTHQQRTASIVEGLSQ